MKNKMVSVLAMAAACASQAATQELMWEKVQQQNLQHLITSTKKSYNLVLLPSSSQQNHLRYQQHYQGIPIWGYHLNIHNVSKGNLVTGIRIQGIEDDLNKTTPLFTAAEVEFPLLAKESSPIRFKKNEKIIYLDSQGKAHLAYHLSYYLINNTTGVKSPNYIIDANSNEILQQWDNAHSENLGQGLGGNGIHMPYRSGVFQYGIAFPNLPSLGKFAVQKVDDLCYVQNESVKVINLKNRPLGYGAFPITVDEEKAHQLDAFSYPCNDASFYVNYTDGSTAPVNYAFSPINDTMYFAEKTLQMYKNRYGIARPIGEDLPIRAFTHLGAMDNAFAIPTLYENGVLASHQQIVIGNGLFFLTAPSQSVIAHELSHNFTELNSGLIYDGQSGGINESFSDMAAIAVQDYLREEFPWYWDGSDWSLGREAMISGKPLRYMDNPAADGMSIDNAQNYKNTLNVHFSSGVFNKAFYLLANKPNWSVQQAFQLMVDANQHYWSPIAYYDFAACGVIQAAVDRRWDKMAVIESFAEVGVHCPIFS